MSEEAQAPAGGGFEVEPEDVKSSKSDTPKTESKESKSQPKSETKSSDGNSESKQEAKDAGPAPWANDLAERGLDDPRIDQYLREVWQPRMTQFEQDLAGWSELFGGDMEAAQIMAGLAEAPTENDCVASGLSRARTGFSTAGPLDSARGSRAPRFAPGLEHVETASRGTPIDRSR